VIEFDGVSFRYDADTPWILRDVTLRVPEGEFTLVVGTTGSGKSTLLRAINGLVPHFTGGDFHGEVRVDGRSTRTTPPRELADVVGYVPQDPMSGFVTDTVEEELAYAMESLGVAPATMRRRVEETLDLLGLDEVRARPLLSLSGGQRQRVAIGAAMASHPRVLILDEPTSALDPGAAEEVLASLQRIVHDLGVTVVIAEHRLERVVQYVDRVLVIEPGGVREGIPQVMMTDAPIAPPVVELGRLAGWNPLPLTIRDARREAESLRRVLVGRSSNRPRPPAGDRRASLEGVDAGYGRITAVRGVDLEVHGGQVLAVMGRNGAGKSTLLSMLAGMVTPTAGRVRLDDVDPAKLEGPELVQHVGLVPQNPTDLLECATVADECRLSDRDAHVVAGTTRALLALLAPDIRDDTHPRDLSAGQQVSLVLAIILAARPPLVVLDEPTRGLDYPTKSRLAEHLRDLASQGHAVVLATHDVELVAEVADTVLILADGEVVAHGPTAEVVTSSPMFAPQVTKIMSPGVWLTVADVESALTEERGS
jgi:energy-coupling factor transport system ATP-binding protein